MKNVKVEVGTFPDNRLKLIVHFWEGKNFWKQEDGSYTWVPKIDKVELISRSLKAIDADNVENKDVCS